MKILWLLSLIYSLILASQTQVVVGSYSNVKNATRAIKELKELIKKDSEFQSFYDEHSLTTRYKVHDKYFRVVIEPFKDSKTQSEALKRFKLIFKNAYVLPIIEEVKPVLKKPVIKRPVVKKPIVKKPIIKKPVVEELLDEQYVEDETVVEAEIPTVDELDEIAIEDAQDGGGINYLLIFSVLFIIIILALYFLRRESKYKKSELNHSIKENEEESDDIFQQMVDIHHIQKIEDDLLPEIQEIQEDNSSEQNILQKMMDIQNKKRAEKNSAVDETEGEPLIVMQNITETINFDALDEKEEDDDEIEIPERTRRKNKARVYKKWQSTKTETKDDD